MISRKILITAAALAATTALSQSAQAKDDGLFFRPYIGAEYQNWSVNYEKFSIPVSDDINFNVDGGVFYPESLNGGAIYLGARVHRYFGLELGYSRTAQDSKGFLLYDDSVGESVDVTTKARVSSISLEALGFLPVWESGTGDRFELIGTLGAARLSYKDKIESLATDESASGTDHEIKLRGGVGFQYTLNDALGFRTLVRYQDADFDKSVKNSLIYSVGLNYTF